MAYHFVNELEKNNIESIATSFNFKNPKYVEKFIMDFEMNYHISQQVDSVIRGGMCVPFHTALGIRRLSIDIDLITALSVNEIKSIMKNVVPPVSGLTITKHVPQNPTPIPNLITYNIEYPSCFGTIERIKVDYLCDVPLTLPTQSFSNGDEVIAFTLDYSSKILTRGALIGDKITTLALNKIGLSKPKIGNLSDDIPKQVYDIASLLKSTSEKDIKESLEVFMSLTEFKTQIYDNGRYDVKNTIETILSSIPSLLSFDSHVTTIPEYVGIFGSFKGTYLNTAQPYKKTDHISDLLLVWFYAICLQKFSDRSVSKDETAKKISSLIQSYVDVLKFDADDKSDLRIHLLNSMPDLTFNNKILNQTPVEQIFLIKAIFSN